MKVRNLAGIGSMALKRHFSHSAASSEAELAGASISSLKNILSMDSCSDELV